MKKYLICLMLAMMFLFSLVGCGATNNSDETTNQRLDANKPTHGAGHQDIPERPEFDTLAEIKSFFDTTRTDGSDTEDSIKNYVSADEVAGICTMADKLVFPTSSEAKFGSAIYFEELQSLDIIYGYNDIQYRFIYYFDNDSVYESESSPELLNVQVGPYKVDFWKIDHPNFPYKYYGYIKIDGVYLVITGLGEDLSEFSFEVFDFVPLSSVGGDVVE